MVYITFDDGPSLQWTPQILKILANHKVHATFFTIGEEAKSQPDLIRQERAAGHAMGNHTFDHKSLPSLSSEGVQTAIKGGVQSRCLRPPYGAINSQVRSIATSLGLSIVMWDVDPRDWARPGTSAIEQRVLDGAAPGAIILMHDGGGDRSQTVAALDHILTTLTQRGYTFETLDC